MGDREIDRQAWAELVAGFLKDEAKGNKSRLASLVDVEYKTINRWLRKEVDVSEESVRKVANGLRRNAAELLVAVGYYSPVEVGLVAPTPPPDYNAAILKVKDDPDLTPRQKVQIIDRIVEIRQQDEARLGGIIDWMISQAKGA